MAKEKKKVPAQTVSKKPRKSSMDSETGTVKDILIGASAEFKTPKEPGKKAKAVDIFKDPPSGQSSPKGESELDISGGAGSDTGYYADDYGTQNESHDPGIHGDRARVKPGIPEPGKRPIYDTSGAMADPGSKKRKKSQKL